MTDQIWAGAIRSSCRKVWKYNSYFKNSYAWLTGMMPMIFWKKKFFGSGLFLIFFHQWWIKKMTRAKKVVNIKNQFFHARQPREGIFDVWSHLSVFLAFLSRTSNCSGSNLGSHWCLKMKSRGLYHAFRLIKSGLLLDFRQVGPPY